MSPGLPARVPVVCVVCALVVASATARAEERRPVAIVYLTDDQEAKKLSDEIYAELRRHWALSEPVKRTHDDLLSGKFLDEDVDALAFAAKTKAQADDHLAQFAYAEAEESAQAGLVALASATPVKAVALAADLAFARGEAELSLKHASQAGQSFAFAHRLDRNQRPDPARYVPEIVKAYEAAIAGNPAKHQLAVHGSGRVWIDGADLGTAPGTFEVDAGEHFVQLADPDRVTTGKLVTVQRDDVVELKDMPAEEELQIQRARLALYQARPDAVSRAGAMKQLAQLLGVHDAVLIWKTEDRLWVQTWRDREPGFSALREHGDESPLELLSPLAPPKPPEPPVVIEPPHQLPLLPRIEAEPPWYRKRWVQASVAGGVVAVVVGAILWARHVHYTTVGTNPSWEMTP